MKLNFLAIFALIGLLFAPLSADAALALKSDLKPNGMSQGDLYNYLSNVTDLVNELQEDHATFRTVIADNKALVNQLRQVSLYNVFGNPGYVISTNFDVKNGTAFFYTNGGTLKTLAANTNCDTGTSKTITGAKWAAALLTVDSSGACVLTWTSLGNYNSEALAIAALAAPAATDTVAGYVTVLAHASGYTAGTDALAGGSGGNVATTTNYYNSINPNTLMEAAAISTSAPAALTNSSVLTLSAP